VLAKTPPEQMAQQTARGAEPVAVARVHEAGSPILFRGVQVTDQPRKGFARERQKGLPDLEIHRFGKQVSARSAMGR